MTTVKEIKKAIEILPEQDFNSLIDWFEKIEEEKWDKELKEDIAEGKLDDFAKEAISEYKTGNIKKL